MTKASSRRSSATVSPAGSDAAEDGHYDDTSKAALGEGKQADDAPSTALSNGTTSTTTATSVKAPDTSAGESQVAGSDSTSSAKTAKSSGAAAASSATATYGTRSTRTRTGTSRPNYAEDSALDAEFELAPPVKEKTSRKAAHVAEPPSSSASDNGKSTANSPQRGVELDQNNAAQNAAKDAIPGTSSFSSASAAPASKKRKANTQNNTTATQNGSGQPAANNRKSGTGFQIAAGFRETNMLTFDNSRSFLKGGKLIADDGTVLALNGTCFITFKNAEKSILTIV